MPLVLVTFGMVADDSVSVEWEDDDDELDELDNEDLSLCWVLPAADLVSGVLPVARIT